MIAEHTNESVVYVDTKSRKQATNLGGQWQECIHNERIRRPLLWLGRIMHHLFGLSNWTMSVQTRSWARARISYRPFYFNNAGGKLLLATHNLFTIPDFPTRAPKV